MIAAFLAGLAIGITLASTGFIWLNRNRPDAVDAAEQKVRDFKK